MRPISLLVHYLSSAVQLAQYSVVLYSVAVMGGANSCGLCGKEFAASEAQSDSLEAAQQAQQEAIQAATVSAALLGHCS